MIGALRSAATLPQVLVSPKAFLDDDAFRKMSAGASLAGIALLYAAFHVLQLAATRSLHPWPVVFALLPSAGAVLKALSISLVIWIGYVASGSAALEYWRIVPLAAALQTITLLHELVAVWYGNSAIGHAHPTDFSVNALTHGTLFVQNMFSLVNPFSIWYAIVLCIGLAKVAPARGTNLIVALAPYFLVVACTQAVVSYSLALHFVRL